MACWAHLKPDTPFNSIFPSGIVPIRSLVPIVPREQGSPLCYVVVGLEDEQIRGLAQMLYEMWRPECESAEQAAEYIRDGLPLKCDYFEGCGTDEYHQMAGGAVGMALRHAEEQYNP